MHLFSERYVEARRWYETLRGTPYEHAARRYLEAVAGLVFAATMGRATGPPPPL